MTVRRGTRPVMGRRLASMVALLVVLIPAGCGTATTPTTTDQPTGLAFLQRYVDPDGRVVRRDQGGDTVSEGQAYALLIAVGTDDRSTFDAVWSWSQAHLLRPDGLLAYHWVGGRVADRNPATDADLDVSRALLLAGSRWRDAADTTAGRRYAAAILTNETVDVGGRTVLVAGPWARRAPYWIDPSYADPATFTQLGAATGDQRWASVAASSTSVLSDVTDGGRQLPPNWATMDAGGRVTASAGPQGGAVLYGYDAVRVPIRQAEACAGSTDRGLSSDLLALTARTVTTADRADTWNLNATPSAQGNNPLALVAAAGSAAAAGRTADRTALLARADRAAAGNPSYFLDAWVALGHLMLTTTDLGPCGS